ncbi:hypothetical protein [Pseudoalteromonas phage J2-1_QLiu-2017]|nr:hypothetical protein [Pseudoalteromonas phage J2-1_QLiu-2017]
MSEQIVVTDDENFSASWKVVSDAINDTKTVLDRSLAQLDGIAPPLPELQGVVVYNEGWLPTKPEPTDYTENPDGSVSFVDQQVIRTTPVPATDTALLYIRCVLETGKMSGTIYDSGESTKKLKVYVEEGNLCILNADNGISKLIITPDMMDKEIELQIELAADYYFYGKLDGVGFSNANWSSKQYPNRVVKEDSTNNFFGNSSSLDEPFQSKIFFVMLVDGGGNTVPISTRPCWGGFVANEKTGVLRLSPQYQLRGTNVGVFKDRLSPTGDILTVNKVI